MSRLTIWMAGAVLCLCVSMAAACPYELPVAKASVHGVALRLEVAESAEERACGLSGRDSLAPDAGMLFVLPREMPAAFWMRNTRLMLDIAFLDRDRRIVDIQTMNPGRTDVLYRSPGPVRYVIEVNRGWFDRHGVMVGDIVELSLPAH